MYPSIEGVERSETMVVLSTHSERTQMHRVRCAGRCRSGRAESGEAGEPFQRKAGHERAATTAKQGLYDPRHEHDACGVGFVVNINGTRSHDIMEKGLEVLQNLAHRGACGCDPENGRRGGHPDPGAAPISGEGVPPDRIDLPAPGRTASAWYSCPSDVRQRNYCEQLSRRSSARKASAPGLADVPAIRLRGRPDGAAGDPADLRRRGRRDR